MGKVTDGERSTQTGLEGQVPGNSEQRARKSPGSTGERSSSGVLVAKEPLSWVYRRPWFRRETGRLRNHRELGNGRKGSWPGTLEQECKAPDLPHGRNTQFWSKAGLAD